MPGRPPIRSRSRATPAPKGPWKQMLLSLFSFRPGLHFLVLVAVTVGFFHGWLKLNFRHPATTFAFDALLSAALVVCIMTLPRGTRFFPPHPITRAILSFYVVVLFYAFIPSDIPWLGRIASLRGWCFPPLLFVLGFHMTHSSSQVKGFFLVLIALGVITGVYGIRQSPAEIAKQMREDRYFAQRYVGAAYGTDQGRVAMRHYSTFISAGAFGGVMAFVSSIALVMMVDASTKRAAKILLAGALLAMCYGIILSGSRSPVVHMALTVGLIAWYRRNLAIPVLAGGAVYLALVWANEFTMGAAGERFATLADKDVLGGRFAVPFLSAYASLVEAPLGTGLGTSSYSIPFFLVASLGRSIFRGAEGDLCCVAVDMGIIGVILFYRILWYVGVTTYRCLRQAAARDDFMVPLAVTSAILPTVIASPVGSPFLGIPTGALTWFFVGCMLKLHTLAETVDPPAAAAPPPVPPGPPKRFLYRRNRR